MQEHELAKLARSDLDVRHLERHADNKREVSEVHVIRQAVAGKFQPARVRLRAVRTIWVAIKSVRVAKTENGMHEHPGGDDSDRLMPRWRKKCGRCVTPLLAKKKSYREQAGAGRHDDEKRK